MTYVISLMMSWMVAPAAFEPARLASGEAMILESPMTAGGGEVLLELDVAPSGEVAGITVLRTTPPYGEQLRASVSRWQFDPARELQEGVEGPVAIGSKVLVACLFRNPNLYNAPARGEIPQDVAGPSPEVPFPTTMAPPLYPPNAVVNLSQTVLVEVAIDARGQVAGSKVIGRGDGLSDAALDAANRWRFRPARRGGMAVPSYAYIVFGFREPVLTGR
jgi:TonB family protein